MSLRCVGDQLLQTAPSLLLAGATTASASLWVRINPGNNVVASKGVEIFGDAGGKFSATLSGTGGLRLQWSSNDGLAGAVSACSMALTPGTTYHLAATWQAGLQRYYLNGAQVGADIRGGSLGVLNDAAPHPIRMGSDQPGADVTLDQPTLWVGYALTPQDVVNLRNRAVQPGGIAPASIALGWSLAGPVGASAKVGDAGLADASPSGLALSSIIGAAPTYQAGDLAYVASPTIGQVVAAPSGKSLVLKVTDGTGAPANITNIASSDEVQSIALVGTPAGKAFTLSFGGHATPPIPVTATPPGIAGTWTIATTPGHNYALAINHQATGTAAFLYETIQGGNVVASVQHTGAGSTGPTDAGIACPNGDLLQWEAVNPGVVASGATIQLRITGSTDGGLVIGGLRVADLTAGTVAHFAVNDPSFSASNLQIAPEGRELGGFYARSGGNAGGLGASVLINGGASALQAALAALPGVGTSGMLVIDQTPPNASGSYQVKFTGNLSGSGQPLITCADPAVSIAESNPGGRFPTLSINGGSPVGVEDWLWVTAGDSPASMGRLPQSAPSVQTSAINQQPYVQNQGWPAHAFTGTLSVASIYGSAAGMTAGFAWQSLPPGTYQIAVTYPSAPFTDAGTIQKPSTATQFLVADQAGTILLATTVNQSIAPTDSTDSVGIAWKTIGTFATDRARTGLTVTMTTVGLTSPAVAVLDGARLTRISADTSVVIGPSDVATLNIPAGWLTTSAGPLPASSAVPVAPPSPTSILPPFVADRKSMKVGYNVEMSPYYANFLAHTNLMTRTGGLLGVAQDSNGYPTKLAQDPYAGIPVGTATAIIIAPTASEGVADPIIGTYVINQGHFTLSWDGSTPGVALIPFYGTTATVVSSTITGGVGNKIIYDLRCDPKLAACPQFQIQVRSTVPDPSDPAGKTFLCDVRNLAIYPPDPTDPTGNTAWASPPKFHPWFLEKLAGVQSLRFLDPLGTNSNCVASFAHFKPATHVDRSISCIYVNAPIARVQAPVDPSTVVQPHFNALVFQVTTTAPHGLYDGCVASVSGVGVQPVSVGGTVDFDQTSQSSPALVKVLDATNFLLYCQGQFGAMTPTGVITPTNATVNANFGSLWPLQDITDLIAAAGCTDLWFNVSIAMDLSIGGCADQVAAFLANHLPAGVKVHVEYSNECWNIVQPAALWPLIANGYLTGNYLAYSYTTYYAQKTKAAHDRFQAVFAANGRPNDIVRVYAGQAGSIGGATDIATKAHAIGGQVDEYAIAFYFDNADSLRGLESTQFPAYDRMSPDQDMDFMEFNSALGRMDWIIRSTLPALAIGGCGSAKIVGYEGSPSVLVPGNLGRPNYAVRQNAVRRNPRMYGVMLHQAQLQQDAGLTLWNYFNLGGGSGPFAWDCWESGHQQPGTGNPALDTVNAANPQDKNGSRCELGGAWKTWAALVKPTTTTTPRKPPRNGHLRTIGIPRGLFRTTR